MQGTLPIGDLIQVADQLTNNNQAATAAQLYREWIKNHASAALYIAHFNLGVILANLQDHEGAEQSYRAALALVPGFVPAHLNLGTALERRGRLDDALDEWRMALALCKPDSSDDKPLQIHALNNLGRLLEIRKDYPAAETMLTKSLALDPKQPEAIAHWVHLRQKLCVWPVFQPFAGATEDDLINAASALALLAGSDDPAAQLAASRRYVNKKVLPLQAPLAAPDGYHHSRLRIGYLSSDFCNHAVSILTAELYALHDRTKFEVYGFCWSREDGSPLRARVVGAMDHYIRIDGMTDEAAARCIREHEIDILVDLHGLTLGTRHDILSWRPAPVQITYLGFPGTTALPAIDYVIADRFVLPEELAPHFTEKPLYLPGCFQINDRQRAIGARPTRAECGLPDDAFVFCSFNSTFKITPEMFGAWMKILRRTSNSVLWLIADSDTVRDTLRQTARQQDVDPDRLIFAKRVAPENYLARYQVADLFLDTNPFNAGTTASDALWAGLPLLTYAGATFGSRMAGSLLHAVGLPELVTHTLADYEEAAVALATDRSRLAALRQRLAENRDGSALFDTPRFVRDYENLLETVVKRPATPPLASEPDPARAHDVPPPAVTLQQSGMLALMRPGMHSVVEVGAATLAQAWRPRHPNGRFTGISATPPAAGSGTDFIAQDPEQLDAAGWQRVAPAQCWLFPGTLEQLRDPWTFLRQLRRKAGDAVELIACVHNGQNWLVQSLLASGALNYQEQGPLDRRNLHLFTRATLASLLQECGFAIVTMNAISPQEANPVAIAAIRQLAAATGADPDLAEQDAMPYQYLVRAIAN